MNPSRFGPGSFRPGCFGLGRLGQFLGWAVGVSAEGLFRPWVVSAMSRFGQILIGYGMTNGRMVPE